MTLLPTLSIRPKPEEAQVSVDQPIPDSQAAQPELEDEEPTPTLPQPSPTPIGGGNGKLVFTSERDGNPEIYSMNADGSGQTRLTFDDANDDNAKWSPDGERIAFSSDRDGNWEIYLMDADGSNPTRLTQHDAADYYPAWSPDGGRIAFVSKRDGNNEIYLMDADGGDQTNLTNTSHAESRPVWTPDGARIVYQAWQDDVYRNDIYVMDADERNQSQLTHIQGNARSAEVSPDGTLIAFALGQDETNGIYVIDMDGGNLRQLIEQNKFFDWPAWSPDGEWIAFESGIHEGDEWYDFDIYAMDFDSGEITQLTTHEAKEYNVNWFQSVGPEQMVSNSDMIGDQHFTRNPDFVMLPVEEVPFDPSEVHENEQKDDQQPGGVQLEQQQDEGEQDQQPGGGQQEQQQGEAEQDQQPGGGQGNQSDGCEGFENIEVVHNWFDTFDDEEYWGFYIDLKGVVPLEEWRPNVIIYDEMGEEVWVKGYDEACFPDEKNPNDLWCYVPKPPREDVNFASSTGEFSLCDPGTRRDEEGEFWCCGWAEEGKEENGFQFPFDYCAEHKNVTQIQNIVIFPGLQQNRLEIEFKSDGEFSYHEYWISTETSIDTCSIRDDPNTLLCSLEPPEWNTVSDIKISPDGRSCVIIELDKVTLYSDQDKGPFFLDEEEEQEEESSGGEQSVDSGGGEQIDDSAEDDTGCDTPGYDPDTCCPEGWSLVDGLCYPP